MAPQAIKAWFLTVLATLGTVIASAFGGWDTAMQVLLSVMTADIITGVLVAIVWKRSGKSQTGAADSRAMSKGLLRKMMMLVAVWVSVNLDVALGLNSTIRTAVILYFTGNEGMSIVENLGIMGIPMPGWFKNAFEQLRNRADPTPGGTGA